MKISDRKGVRFTELERVQIEPASQDRRELTDGEIALVVGGGSVPMPGVPIYPNPPKGRGYFVP